MLIPSVALEYLLKGAPIAKGADLTGIMVLTHCLAEDYLGRAVDLLEDAGLFSHPFEDEEVRVFDTYDDLVNACNNLMLSPVSALEFETDRNDFDWLEAFGDAGESSQLRWFAKVSVESVCRKTANLEVYAELKMAIGPHATEEARADRGGVFYCMVGGEGGGQLCSAIRRYLYGQGENTTSPAFLSHRIADFFLETTWPEPYRYHPNNLDDYPYDLYRRASWKAAGKDAWPSLVQNRMSEAIKKLPTLYAILEDLIEEPAGLTREYQTVGDLVLAAMVDPCALPFWKILSVENYLKNEYGGFIISEREGGVETAGILQKLLPRLRQALPAKTGATSTSTSEELTAPKPGQITRALADQKYAQIETKYMEELRAPSTLNDQRVTILGASLSCGSILPHAVLFATKGMRLSVYIGHTGSDFLTLLYADRHLLGLLLGQTLAYDPVEKKVPKELLTFKLSKPVVEMITEFKWDELDPLNDMLLKLRAETAGTQFAKHKIDAIYHSADMVLHIKDTLGKIFIAIGYPATVQTDLGMSFQDLLDRVNRILEFALALPTDEQRGVHKLIDDIVARAFVAAQEGAKRAIYGPSPADRRLPPWLSAEEAVYIELNEIMDHMKDAAKWRRRLGGSFLQKAKAASLPGFSYAPLPARTTPLPSASVSCRESSAQAPEFASHSGPPRCQKAEAGTGRLPINHGL